MSQSLVRERFSAIAVRVETPAGVDAIAGSPVQADFIIGSAQVRYNATTVQDPSFSGALDDVAPALGALMPTIEVNVPLRGSGAAGTAPSWGRLMRACCFEEVVDNTGVVSTAATAGAASTATLPSAFSSTAQLYRGVPAILSGNPAPPVITPIHDYTAGRVASFNEIFSPVLSTSTMVQIPANVLYRPTSDETLHKTVTVYLYGDGMVWIFTGVSGSMRAALTSGGIGTLTFSLRGQYSSLATATLPAGLTAAGAPTPPRWVGGRVRFLSVRAQLKTLTVDAGINVTMPDDPEATEGYGPAVPISRAVTATLDPLMDTTTQVSVFNNFRAGTGGRLSAIIGATAGNRFAVTLPFIRALQMDPGSREGLRANDIRAQADSPDASMFLCAF